MVIITINRPEVHNCVDGETAQGLRAAWERFRDDPSALDTLSPRTENELSDLVYGGSGYLGFTRLTDVFKPTIAAINGYCFAGGLEMAGWCDIRLAADHAEFGFLERRWNVPLVDGGTQPDRPAFYRRRGAADGPGDRGGSGIGVTL